MSNKKRISVFIVVIALTAVLVFVSATRKGEELKELTKKEKEEDFEYMYDIIKDNYVYFYDGEGISEEDWIESKDYLKKRIVETKNNLEFYNVMDDIFSNYLGLHTDILDPLYYRDLVAGDFTGSFKKIFRKSKTKYEGWTELLEKAYPEKYTGSNASFAMSLRNGENINTEILEKDKIAYLRIGSFAIDHDQNNRMFEKEKKEIEDFLRRVKDYPYLIIDVSDNGGGSSMYWINSLAAPLGVGNVDDFIDGDRFYVSRGGDYSMKYIKKDEPNIYKNKIEDLDFYSSLSEEIKKNFKYYRKSDDEGSREANIEFAKNSGFIGFKGKKFVIINENTASAATEFTEFCKWSGFAKLVGTSTAPLGGKDIYALLPNSGLIIRIECELSLLMLDKEGNFSVESKISPDIEVEKSKFGKYGIREKYNTKVIKEIIDRIDSDEFK